MISDIAGVPELVRYITRGHESLARPQCEDLVSYGSLQFAGEDKIRLILTRMCMTRHTLAGRDFQIEEAISSSRIFARKKDRTKGNVEIVTLRLWFILDCRSDIKGGCNVRHELTPFCCKTSARVDSCYQGTG